MVKSLVVIKETLEKIADNPVTSLMVNPMRHAGLLEKRNSMEYQFAVYLLEKSKGNTDNLMRILRNVAANIELRETDNLKKLIRKTLRIFSSMVSVARDEIIFTRDETVGDYYKARPILVYQTYAQSGLAILGIVPGTPCIGLSGRFVYINPEILSFLKNFKNISPENVDLFVLGIALKHSIINEISILLRDGLLDSIKNQQFVPDWNSWSCYILEDVIQSDDYVDIFHSFVKYIKDAEIDEEVVIEMNENITQLDAIQQILYDI